MNPSDIDKFTNRQIELRNELNKTLTDVEITLVNELVEIEVYLEVYSNL